MPPSSGCSGLHLITARWGWKIRFSPRPLLWEIEGLCVISRDGSLPTRPPLIPPLLDREREQSTSLSPRDHGTSPGLQLIRISSGLLWPYSEPLSALTSAVLTPLNVSSFNAFNSLQFHDITHYGFLFLPLKSFRIYSWDLFLPCLTLQILSL